MLPTGRLRLNSGKSMANLRQVQVMPDPNAGAAGAELAVAGGAAVVPVGGLPATTSLPRGGIVSAIMGD